MKKLQTGIAGLDEVTGGGIPRSRPTLIAGGAGCGKSLLALSIAAHAADTLGEPAVFMSFEEQPSDIVINARSIGIDLERLMESGLLELDYAGGGMDSPQEIGNYSLDGLLIRLGAVVDESGARIVAMDTIETLYTMFENSRLIRRELARLFRWCKERSITLIVTGEAGQQSLTRYGLEEYVSDCVIFLTHTVTSDLSTRRLRIIKYRGAKHGTNEFPFIIDDHGLQVMPITAAELDHVVSTEYRSTGMQRIDQLLGGKGLRQGSTVLLSGKPGAGKTNLAMTVAQAAAGRGEKVVYFNFEESPSELASNVSSVGIDIRENLESKRLILSCARPTLHSLEHHLVEMYRVMDETRPSLAIIDPLSGLYSAGSRADVFRTLIRLVDTLKSRQITVLATLNQRAAAVETSDFDIAPMSDVWIHLDNDIAAIAFQRTIEVVKARGLNHHRGSLAFEISPNGLQFGDDRNDSLEATDAGHRS